MTDPGGSAREGHQREGHRGEGHRHEDHAEAFPRLLTSELVGAAEAAEHRRLVLVEIGLGLALASFALALPVETLLGRGVALVAGLGEGRWSGPHLLTSCLVALLGRAGLELERAGFLVSALSLALCLPLAGSLGRRLGAPPRLATLGALVVALSPAAWHAASLPGPDAPGLAVSLALCGALLGRERRVLALAVLAPLVDLTLVWLLPAVFLASGGRGSRVGWRGGLLASGSALGGLLLAHALAAALDPARELAALPAELGRALLALDGRTAPWSWPALSGLGALGLGLAGLAALPLVRRGPEEEPPPSWLWAWCLGPLAAHVPGALPPLWLVPPALLGGLDLLSRVPEARALRLLALVAAGQLVLLLGTGAALREADPLAPWRARASAGLGPGDVYLGADADRLHLVRLRYGLETIDLRRPPDRWSDAARAAAARGARLVLDGQEPLGEPARSLQHEEVERLLVELCPAAL